MDFFKKAFSRAITKAVNPDVFAYYFNKHFPPQRSIKYNEAYTSWVFACINAIAQDTAKIQLISQRKKGTDWETVEDTDPLRLLKKPNPVMTGHDLITAISSWKQIDGNTFLYVAYNLNNKPMELWPLDPTRMIILKDELKIVDGYNYLNQIGKLVPLTFPEVVHLKTFNPADAYRGLGTVEAAKVAIETDVFASKWNRNFFQNSATPDTVLQTDKKLSDEVYKRLKKAWNNEYKGVDNAHKLAILEEGLSLKPTSLTQSDMEFLQLRGFNRDEINAMFGVPKIRHGFIEGTNRASADTIEYVYIKNTILNEITFIIDKLNAFYLPLWGVDPNKERIWFQNPVPDDEELLIEKKESGLKNGYYTINEVRAMDNLEPVAGGDTLYIPALMQPLPDGTTDDENAPEEEEETPTSKSKKKTKSVGDSFRDSKTTEGKKAVLDIYAKMQKHVDDKFTSRKSARRSKPRSRRAKFLSRMKDTLDEDGAADITLLNVLSDFDDTFSPEVRTFISGFSPDVYKEGGENTFAGAEVDGSFDLKNPRAVSWLEKHALELATQVPSSVKDEMSDIIKAGVDNGDSTDTIRENISQFYEDQSSWRAERVARTEVTTSYEQGSLEGAKQAGFTEKSWEKRGETQADVCNDNQDQGWIGIDESFESGNVCPAAHPNCECGCVYR